MSTGGGSGSLVPTYHGFVQNSMDGLVLFEACLSGKLHHVPRRPHDRERSSLIRSGSIFIYEENASGIKRWTDGVAWSPSRILGNFLIYRELEKPFPPGEKKRAMKRKRSGMPGELYPSRDSDQNETGDLTTPFTPPTPNAGGEVQVELPSTDQDKDFERSLIGSLVDSYGFRPDGLVKKTMSISVNGISHHMVSYYKVDDVKNRTLQRPLADAGLQGTSVRPELYLKQNFRAPVEESEHYAIDGQIHAHPHLAYSSMAAGAYGVRPGQYFGHQYPMYGISATSAANLYGGMTGTSWPAQQAPTSAIAYGSHPAYTGQNHSSCYKDVSTQHGTPAVKSEDHQATAHSLQYGTQYGPSYSTQRESTQSTPGNVQSAYDTPGSSTFGSMSAHGGRPSYGNNTMPSPSSNGHSQQMYATASVQPYAVRSPTQSYGMQSEAPSVVSQSPHPGAKSPMSATPTSSAPQMLNTGDPSAQMQVPHIPYRSGSYPLQHTPQSAHPSHDVNGLGISNNANYQARSQNGHNYSGYANSGQAFRAVGEVAAAQAGPHYQR